MIIFGTRGITYNKAKGEFHCPSCRERNYQWRRVRRFFTLYFIPVIPLDLLGEYIECDTCQDTFKLGVLEYDPRGEQQAFEAEYQRAIKRVMILMVIADGVVDDEELQVVVDTYKELAGIQLSFQQVAADARLAKGDDVQVYVRAVAGSLNDAGKEKVLDAAWRVANADGDFAQEEQDLLLDLGEGLGMTRAHVRGVLAELAG